ncbi:hypothetical protein ABIB49_000459 [Arthrobacter sp. UYCu512]|uniref:hypothetical protein n=1 Tax=Arthrobacter sp. UYCu512 TaxID=3156338 RepID=UPI003390B137
MASYSHEPGARLRAYPAGPTQSLTRTPLALHPPVRAEAAQRPLPHVEVFTYD